MILFLGRGRQKGEEARLHSRYQPSCPGAAHRSRLLCPTFPMVLQEAPAEEPGAAGTARQCCRPVGVDRRDRRQDCLIESHHAPGRIPGYPRLAALANHVRRIIKAPEPEEPISSSVYPPPFGAMQVSLSWDSGMATGLRLQAFRTQRSGRRAVSRAAHRGVRRPASYVRLCLHRRPRPRVVAAEAGRLERLQIQERQETPVFQFGLVEDVSLSMMCTWPRGKRSNARSSCSA